MASVITPDKLSLVIAAFFADDQTVLWSSLITHASLYSCVYCTLLLRLRMMRLEMMDGVRSVSVRLFLRPLRELSAWTALNLLLPVPAHLNKPGPYRAMRFDVMWPHSAPIMKSSLPENDSTGIKSSRYRAHSIVAAEMLARARKDTHTHTHSNSECEVVVVIVDANRRSVISQLTSL